MGLGILDGGARSGRSPFLAFMPTEPKDLKSPWGDVFLQSFYTSFECD